ncbi:hypothetical protein [Evansella clarkii]|uniref:hypothetical protein n=1 Tax=Evansella clarkii TaxID=79879 RepID=UPI00099709C3|nr:hypothetical protein [Evansella clarkii]
MVRKTYLLIFVVLLLSACNVQSSEDVEEEEYATSNPTAEEILSSSPDADIFMTEDIIYTYAEDIDWVMELDLTLGEEVTEITNQTNNSSEFKNGTATELPVGTKIYKPNEKRGAIYIAIVDGKEIRYIGLIEG